MNDNEKDANTGEDEDFDKAEAFKELMGKMMGIMDSIDETDADEDKKAEGKAAIADMMSILAQKTIQSEMGDAYELPAETIHLEDTDKFFEKHFPGERFVWHEIISEVVHIDIHVIYPTEERQYYVLYTTGMSDLPMTVPEDFTEEEKAKWEYAELMILLPADWKIDKESLKDEKWYWPIRAMKSAARYPHLCETWIGHCHDIEYSEACEPFAENTKLCGFLFAYPPVEEMRSFTASDGCRINIYCCIPIYEEEMNEKIAADDYEDGGTELLCKLFGEGDVLTEQLVVDINRKNVAIN